MNQQSLVAIDFETNPIPYFEKRGRSKLTGLDHPRLAPPILMTHSDGKIAQSEDSFSKELLKDKSALVFHNAAFDIPVGVNAGLWDLGIQSQKEIHCTLNMAKLLRNNRSSGLKDLAESKLGVKSATRYQEASKQGDEGFRKYAENDALYTARLFSILSDELKNSGQWDLYDLIERPFMRVNLECQDNGLLFNLARSNQLTDELNLQRKSILDHIGSGVNWNSPKQVMKKIYGEWGLPLQQYKGKVSTSRKALKKLEGDSRVSSLITFKDVESSLRQLKQLKRFIHPESGAIHPYINTLGADTGRSTSSLPNLQNIAKDSSFRSLFIARPGHQLLVLDFGQIEPRVLANFLNPSAFSKLFSQDEDFYQLLAREVFSEQGVSIPSRSIAKQVVLAVLYGMGPKTLAENLGIQTKEAVVFLERFFSAYPEIGFFRAEKIQHARGSGYVEGLFNRRRFIECLNDPDEKDRLEAERQAFNAVIQGSAATLFKHKLVRLRKALPASVKFLLHVHDEVILEVPEVDALSVYKLSKQILEAPENWFSIPIRVEGGIGPNWADAKLKPKTEGEVGMHLI